MTGDNILPGILVINLSIKFCHMRGVSTNMANFKLTKFLFQPIWLRIRIAQPFIKDQNIAV